MAAIMTRARALGRFVLLLALCASAARASELPGTPLDAPWRLLGFATDPAPEVRPSGCSDVTLTGLGVVGFAYRPVADGVAVLDRLSWRWRVEGGPPATDLAARGGDDRAVAVHVWYPAEDEGLFGAMRRRLTGLPRVGRAISYVWGGRDGDGRVVDNPYLDGGVQVLLRPAGAGAWSRVEVDLAADHARAFDKPAPVRPAFIAVSTDVDDTASRVTAAVADLAFIARDGTKTPACP